MSRRWMRNLGPPTQGNRAQFRSNQALFQKMWLYEQSTGTLSSTEAAFIAIGYSGNGAGKNNPAMQSVIGVGPIPCGVYAIGAPFDSIEHGPFAMRLAPDAANEMFGRSGFLMHGDSREHPGCASEGCIILPRDAREAVAASADRELRVLSGPVIADTKCAVLNVAND